MPPYAGRYRVMDMTISFHLRGRWTSRWFARGSLLLAAITLIGCPLFIIDGQRCANEASCDDGVFCNGAETCVDGICMEGTSPCGEPPLCCNESADRCDNCCANGDCDDADPCTVDSCNDGACVNADIANCCAADAECGNGDACDGAATCVNNQCVPGTPVVCDDGVFCNGVETCAAGQCVAGTSPCPGCDVCVETGECLTFIECVFDSDCDDGMFCNGRETCCTFQDDCPDGCGCKDGLPPCDPSACEVCDEDARTCEVIPTCASDADCDDGLFCNGEETCCTLDDACADGCGCLPGLPPCDPRDEICDEETDVCDRVPPNPP